MPLQSTVNVLLNVGVIGDILLDEPYRVQPVTLDNNGGTLGNFFTKSNSTGIATQGGTITNGSVVFGGIAVNSKIEPLFGSSATNPLAANETLQPNSQVALMTMGSCLVSIGNAFNIGDLVSYNTTTGAITSYAPGGSPPGGSVQMPNAVVYGVPSQGGLSNSAAAGLAIVRLTN